MIYRIDKGIPDTHLTEARLDVEYLRDRLLVAEEKFSTLLWQQGCTHLWIYDGVQENFFDMEMHHYHCSLCSVESFGRSPEYYND